MREMGASKVIVGDRSGMGDTRQVLPFGTTPEVTKVAIIRLEQIARAVELGLGASSPDMIELVTDDKESKTLYEF